MKKRILLLLAAAFLFAALCGCAASMKTADSIASAPAAYYGNDVKSETATEDSDTAATMENDDTPGDAALTTAAGRQSSFLEKIIYSARADIETVKFDESVDKIYELVGKYGAFLESSNVSGSTYRAEYYGYHTYRWAEFVIRVPSENYAGMTGSLEEIGVVTNCVTDIQNITEQFYDAQARLETYETEEERLLAMLEKCETVTDMIEIESRLSDVRYEIESLQFTLKNWQNEVDYSTVTICLNEVEELRDVVENERTYWQEIGDGLRSSVKSVGRFFKDLFRNIIIALPVLVILAVLIVAMLLILRAIFGKKAREKRRLRRDENLGKEENREKEDHEKGEK